VPEHLLLSTPQQTRSCFPSAIAVDAADELLPITVNLDERLMAAVAVHRVRLYFGPSFLSLPDSLM
jgi:hypothetical protein